MEWLTQNWFWVVVFVAFVAMHLFGHGGHGGHGGGGYEGGHGQQRPPDEDERKSQPPAGHQH